MVNQIFGISDDDLEGIRKDVPVAIWECSGSLRPFWRKQGVCNANGHSKGSKALQMHTKGSFRFPMCFCQGFLGMAHIQSNGHSDILQIHLEGVQRHLEIQDVSDECCNTGYCGIPILGVSLTIWKEEQSLMSLPLLPCPSLASPSVGHRSLFLGSPPPFSVLHSTGFAVHFKMKPSAWIHSAGILCLCGPALFVTRHSNEYPSEGRAYLFIWVWARENPKRPAKSYCSEGPTLTSAALMGVFQFYLHLYL